MLDPLLDVIKNTEEPGWLESPVVGNLRVWQLMFLALAGLTTLTVMICCCFRFRIPRTKQKIEADYQRREITKKFRQQLETIQDSQIDAMSLKDVLEVLHENTRLIATMEVDKQQDSSIITPQPSSLDCGSRVEGGQRPEPQVSGLNFVKFATKVAHISKLAPKSPTSPTSGEKMDF